MAVNLMVMYMCARGMKLASFYVFLLNFGIIPTMWDFFFFFFTYNNYVLMMSFTNVFFEHTYAYMMIVLNVYSYLLLYVNVYKNYTESKGSSKLKSCSTFAIHRVTRVTNPVTSHE